MSDTSLDKELTILENLDFNIECGYEECGNRAAWLLTSRCCASEWLMCDEHRSKFLENLRNRKARSVCTKCGFKFWASEVVMYDWVKL